MEYAIFDIAPRQPIPVAQGSSPSRTRRSSDCRVPDHFGSSVSPAGGCCPRGVTQYCEPLNYDVSPTDDLGGISLINGSDESNNSRELI